MSNYDNNMSGALFKNDRKEKDSHPDYKGQAEVDGIEYWVSAWIKEGKKGKFMSLAFTKKEEEREPSKSSKPSKPLTEMDDDIPF